MRECERFVTTPIENPMFCSGLAFHSWQSPGTHEECIRKAKALRLPTLRELIDLKWIVIRKSVL